MARRWSTAQSPDVPLHAALDLAALRTRHARAGRVDGDFTPSTIRRPRRGAIFMAVAIAALLLGLSSTGTLAATTVTPKCDATNLRTGASTSYTKKTSVNTSAKLTVVATVTGGSYATSCNGISLTGSSWYKFNAINGKSVSSLYGVTYLYGASKLF
ncbi:MAG: hypothetical protein ABI620_08420, partial [Chloroflexota bacterium]